MLLIRFSADDQSVRNGVLEDGTVSEMLGSPFEEFELTGQTWRLDEIRLRAPVRPTKIVGVATNFPGATGRTGEMTEPLVFVKPPSSLTGPSDTICSPFKGQHVWGESELAIIIGKTISRATDKLAGGGNFWLHGGERCKCRQPVMAGIITWRGQRQRIHSACWDPGLIRNTAPDQTESKATTTANCLDGALPMSVFFRNPNCLPGFHHG